MRWKKLRSSARGAGSAGVLMRRSSAACARGCPAPSSRRKSRRSSKASTEGSVDMGRSIAVVARAPAAHPGYGKGMIEVERLQKHYKVHKRPPGFKAALRSLFHRPTETVRAVDDVSFQIGPGERVGFLGPNGAGKTTTLKVLSGLLYPTAAPVRVAGYSPQERTRPL